MAWRVFEWIARLALGLLLWSGWKLPYSATFTALLLGGFLTAMAITFSRGIEAQCGCFGSNEPISPRTLARDSLLFLLAVSLAARAWWERRGKQRIAAVPS